MESLNNKISIFREYRGYNAYVRSLGRSGDWKKKNELKKRPKESQLNLSVMNHSQTLFKIEMKADINPYKCHIDALNLNHLL